MNLLHVTSYGVDKEYDFTPNIPSFCDAYKMAVRKMCSVVPFVGYPPSHSDCDMHKADALSQISDNRFGYTVHETPFHKCWTIGTPSNSEETNVPQPPIICGNLVESAKCLMRDSIENLCMNMNNTVLCTVASSLASRGLVPHSNGMICGYPNDVVYELGSILSFLFKSGGWDDIEGIHGIVMSDKHPWCNRSYQHKPVRHMIAIQVKDMRNDRILSLKQQISDRKVENHWDDYRIVLYDTCGNDEDYIFDDDHSIVLWSFGYDKAEIIEDLGYDITIGIRPLVLRKIKTAPVKQYRVTFSSSPNLRFNVPEDVAILASSEKSMTVYLDQLDSNNRVFFSLRIVRKHGAFEANAPRYGIFYKSQMDRLKEDYGITVKYLPEERYAIKCAGFSSDMEIVAEDIGVSVFDINSYFSVRIEDESVNPLKPKISLAEISEFSDRLVKVSFAFQFSKSVDIMDSRKCNVYALPITHFAIIGAPEGLINYKVAIPEQGALVRERIGFGEQSIMVFNAMIDNSLLSEGSFIIRIDFNEGALIGSGTSNENNGVMKINSLYTLQFVFCVEDGKLVAESVYSFGWRSGVPWSPIVPKRRLLNALKLDDVDIVRGLCLTNSTNYFKNDYLMTSQDGTTINKGIVDRPQTEFPYTIKITADNLSYDENPYFAVLRIPVPNNLGSMKHLAVTTGLNQTGAVIKDIVLADLSIRTVNCRSMPFDLGAECYSVYDRDTNNGNSIPKRIIQYHNLPVRVVNGIMKLPISFDASDELIIDIDDFNTSYSIKIQVNGTQTDSIPPITEVEDPDNKQEGESI